MTTTHATMTNQEAFDKALQGIRGQNYVRSVDEDGSCAYRSDVTAECKVRCGVGHLIPDELYSAELEGRGVPELRRLSIFEPIAGLFTSPGALELLISIQVAHDECLARSPLSFEEEMQRTANRFGLVYTPNPALPLV